MFLINHLHSFFKKKKIPSLVVFGFYFFFNEVNIALHDMQFESSALGLPGNQHDLQCSCLLLNL